MINNTQVSIHELIQQLNQLTQLIFKNIAEQDYADMEALLLKRQQYIQQFISLCASAVNIADYGQYFIDIKKHDADIMNALVKQNDALHQVLLQVGKVKQYIS